MCVHVCACVCMCVHVCVCVMLCVSVCPLLRSLAFSLSPSRSLSLSNALSLINTLSELPHVLPEIYTQVDISLLAEPGAPMGSTLSPQFSIAYSKVTYNVAFMRRFFFVPQAAYILCTACTPTHAISHTPPYTHEDTHAPRLILARQAAHEGTRCSPPPP